jgi:Phosphatidylglycerophosphate synthase
MRNSRLWNLKYLANSLSLLRFLLAIFLPGIYQFSIPLFLFIYLSCGVSDILDGYIARKTNSQTRLGAQLDSLADLALFCSITVLLFVRWAGDELAPLLPLLLAILTVRVINLIVAGIKFRSLAMLHTWANKVSGLLVFAAPLVFVAGCPEMLVFIGIVAMLAALEESIIHLTSDRLDLNRRSIFGKK